MTLRNRVQVLLTLRPHILRGGVMKVVRVLLLDPEVGVFKTLHISVLFHLLAVIINVKRGCAARKFLRNSAIHLLLLIQLLLPHLAQLLLML